MSPLDFGSTDPLAPPLYPSSVYHVPDLDAVDALYEGRSPGYYYARYGHPNAQLLAGELADLSSAKWGLVTSSGMAALSAACLALLKSGDRVVASNRLYGTTTKLLGGEFSRYGVTTTFVDTNDLSEVESALDAGPAKLLLAETISNPLGRIPDLPALAEIARARQCRLLVDNTFATPVLCTPLDLGADLVMESLTKMIGGHSDVTLGFLGGNDPELLPAISAAVSTWGLMASPFDCWLTQRGLPTLDLRVRTAAASAAAVADWLAGQPGVVRVVYPGRPDHPDHDRAKRILPAGAGYILCFELAGGRDAVNRFMRSAPGVPFCPSLGHAATTCSHPGTTSHRSDSPAEKARQGITDGLIRLSVGCESVDRIKEELAKGLVVVAG